MILRSDRGIASYAIQVKAQRDRGTQVQGTSEKHGQT